MLATSMTLSSNFLCTTYRETLQKSSAVDSHQVEGGKAVHLTCPI